MSNKKIAFIGGGNMATAIIARMADHWDEHSNIHVLDLNDNKLDKLHNDFGITPHKEIGPWLSEMDCVIFAVKPQQLPEALSDAKEFLKNNFVLSIAAGVKIRDIEKLLGHNRICRVMPNTPVKEGLGVCGIYMASEDEEDKKTVEEILSPAGLLIWCSFESMIDSVTAVSGSGPAYVFLFLLALEKAALEFGFTAEQSRQMAIYTVLGSATLAKNSDEPFSELCRKVQSKGGTTIEATKIIEGSGFQEMMLRAMQACRTRAIELGDEFSESVENLK